MLLWILILAGLSVTGIALMPSLVQPATDRFWKDEERILGQLRVGLEDAIRIRQAIPASTNWAGFVASTTGLNTTLVQQVWTAFPGDTNSRRILLLDTVLTTSVLPYTQNTNGLQGAQTNLIGTNSRALLISNTKRDLALPVSGGVASSATAFNSIWNWVYDPSTKAPPTGWPSSWTGNGNHLHVQPINLANLFSTATMSNVLYTVNNSSTSSIISRTERVFLRGTLLAAYRKDGTPLGRRVINRPVNFFQAEDCPWIAADIGSVGAAGSTSCGATNLTLNGSGSGFSTLDEFHFGYQDSTGDTEITARLTFLSSSGTSSKEAGVMLRASTAANADYLAVTYSQSKRIYLRYRYSGNVVSSYTSVGVDPPAWVRVRRVGNTFYAYYSLNGSTWTTLLTGNAAAPGFTKTGLVVTSFNDGSVATATFDNISIVQ